ncbi:MAG: hypothetical protein AB1801_08175, partial [Chloroflexota bacterium]
LVSKTGLVLQRNVAFLLPEDRSEIRLVILNGAKWSEESLKISLARDVMRDSSLTFGRSERPASQGSEESPQQAAWQRPFWGFLVATLL